MASGLRDRHGDAYGGGVLSGLRPGVVGNRQHQRERSLAFKMPLDRPPLEDLRDRIGGDEAEAPQLCARPCQNVRGAVPPVHHEIGAFVHLRMRRPKRFGIGSAQPGAQILAADEGRVADDELRHRPVRPARVGPDLPAVADAVEGPLIPCQHRVALVDVVELLEDRFPGREAASSEMPLQMPDPEHEIGDGDRSAIGLHAEELLRPHRVPGEAAERLGAAELARRIEYLALQLLHELLRDMEEIPGAAGRVEHTRRAQRPVKALDQRQRLLRVAAVARLLRGAEHRPPVLSQRPDHRLDDQPLDIGARRVMGTEPGPLLRVERLFQQRAEDRRLDLLPVVLRGGEQFADLRAAERIDLGPLVELAVEALHALAHRGRVGSLVHRLPQLRDQRQEGVGIVAAVAQQRLEGILADQPDILGEHREQAAHQEQRHLLGIMVAFQRLRHRRQPFGNGAGDARGMARRIERERIAPDRGEALAHGLVAQIVEMDAVALPVGELDVVLTLPGEVGVEFEAVADIADDQEGRPAMRRRQRLGIVLGLAPGVEHQHVPGAVGAAPSARPGRLGEGRGAPGGQQFLRLPLPAALLRLQHEGALLVEVDPSGGVPARTVGKAHRVLEAIADRGAIAGRRLRRLDADQPAQFGQELGIGGALRSLRYAPAADERLDVILRRRRHAPRHGTAPELWQPHLCNYRL